MTGHRFFLVSLIEHKAKVDYNVVMQIFRYMTFIWEDYEREQERRMGELFQTSRHMMCRQLGGRQGKKVYRRGERKETERTNKLTRILLAQNRIDDLKRAAEEPAYQEQLFYEFGL